MSLGAKVAALFGRRAFNISPAVSGKSTWDLDNDGPLNLSTAGSWTITPLSSFLVQAKAWGAGAKSDPAEPGGAGGYATGYVLLVAGVSYTLYVGGTSIGNAGGVPGGGSITGTGFTATPGAGYSGLQIGSTAVLIAGGGGGHGHTGAGGAGGGLVGEDGQDSGGNKNGKGGSQVAGGLSGASSALPRAGSQYQGGSIEPGGQASGGGGGGYYGGGASVDPGGASTGGAGGGSSYANAQYVVQSALTSGARDVPGNSGDSDRGTSGDSGQAGRVKLT